MQPISKTMWSDTNRNCHICQLIPQWGLSRYSLKRKIALHEFKTLWQEVMIGAVILRCLLSEVMLVLSARGPVALWDLFQISLSVLSFSLSPSMIQAGFFSEIPGWEGPDREISANRPILFEFLFKHGRFLLFIMSAIPGLRSRYVLPPSLKINRNRVPSIANNVFWTRSGHCIWPSSVLIRMNAYLIYRLC